MTTEPGKFLRDAPEAQTQAVAASTPTAWWCATHQSWGCSNPETWPEDDCEQRSEAS